jgi:hypothetical protein
MQDLDATVLASAPVYVSLPTTDLVRARSFYETRPPSRAEHTAAFFVVDDFDQSIAELRARGLALHDYDLPHMKTQNGVLVPSNAGRRAWVPRPGRQRTRPV